MSEKSRLLPLPPSGKLINDSTGSRINQGGDAYADSSDSSSQMRKSSWTDSVLILVGAIMGSGTLGLPFALTKLGWYVGTAVCVLFGLAAIYSGLLLGRVENKYCRGAESFSEAARVLVGPKFESFTRWAIWMNWLFLLPYYLMSITHALKLAVGEKKDGDDVMCFYDWTLCIMAALIGMLQIRTLDSLSWMAGSSAMAIVLAMTLLLVDFAVFSPEGPSGDLSFGPAFDQGSKHHNASHNSSGNNTPAGHGHLWPEKGTSFIELYGSTATFVFAYQGQSIFFEIMREMKQPTQFKKAISVANTIMIGVYLIIISLCYYYKGDTLTDFLPNSMTNKTLRKIVGGLVAYNLFSAYLLTNVPLALAWHQRLIPETARDFKGFKAKVHWFFLTLAILIFSFLVANAIPFFGSFQGIIGASLGAPILFGWPPLFYVLAVRKRGGTIPLFDKVVCGIFMCILFPMCFGCGIYSSVDSMVTQWANNSPPFSCHPQ